MFNMFPQKWIVTVKLCERCQRPVLWSCAVWSPPYYYCSLGCASKHEGYINRVILGPAYEAKRTKK